MQLNHLHLHVRDVGRARRFYETYFGFHEHVWHGPVLFLRDGGGLDLALAPAASIEPMPDWFHFGFRLPSPGAVRDLYHSLCAGGETITVPLSEEEGFVGFRCADPDGYAVEVYWE